MNNFSRIIWLGDLNYRVSLSYEETRFLLEDNDWDTLLEKDQVGLLPLEITCFQNLNSFKVNNTANIISHHK